VLTCTSSGAGSSVVWIGMPPTADLKGWIAPENGEGE